MVSLYRTTLVRRDGSFIMDAVTRRSLSYDRLRQATAGRWFSADPDLERYAAYRAAVIAERRLRSSPAAVAASGNHEVAKELLTAIETPRTAAAQLDRVEAAISRIAATSFPGRWSIDHACRMLAAVHAGGLSIRAARAQIACLARRSGSLARWYQPIAEVDILALTEPPAEWAEVIIHDLRTAGWDGEAVAVAHGLPPLLVTELTRGIDPEAPHWRDRVRERLRPVIAETMPAQSAHPPLHALRLEVEVAESVAMASRLACQSAALRALAPFVDQQTEHLVSPGVALQARVVSVREITTRQDDTISSNDHAARPPRAAPTAWGQDNALHRFPGWRDHPGQNAWPGKLARIGCGASGTSCYPAARYISAEGHSVS